MKTANHRYYLPSGKRSNKGIAYANALSIELLPYGINLSEDLFNRIAENAAIAPDFCKEILEEYTIGKLNRPLFKNWEKRTYFSFEECMVQILGYMFQISGNDLEDPSYMENLLTKVNFKKEKTLALAGEQEAKNKFLELTEAKVSQDKKNQKVLQQAAIYFADSLEGFQRIFSDEARAAVLSFLKTKQGLNKSLVTLKCKSSDVLRYAAAKKSFDGVKLPSDVIYGSLTWNERTESLKFLESFSFDDLCESMGQNRESWIRWFKHIHLFNQKDFINRYPVASLAARISMGFKTSEVPKKLHKLLASLVKSEVVEVLATGNPAYRTFASRVASAVENKNYVKIEQIFQKNGGYLLRNLATVANGVDKKNEGNFVNLVRSKLAKASAAILFSILSINVNAKYRIIDVKGNTLIEEANYPRVIADIQGDIKREIHRRWGYAGKAEVTDVLKDRVVPFLSKNADLDRGTKISFQNTSYLYFLMHWIQKPGSRTDLDHSYVCFDDSWNAETVYFGNQANAFISHSGDITNAPAPNGATEYGRINLSKIPARVKYIVPIMNVFAGDVFSENKEAYAGFMFSDEEKFSIERKHTRYNLTQPANSNIPFVIDVRNKEILILDFNNRERHGLTAHSEIGNMKKLISAAEDKYVITMGVLAEILSGDKDETSLKICKNAKNAAEIEPENLFSLFN